MHVDDGQLNALLDGELDADEARRVEDHVKVCADCARRLAEARAFLAESGELLSVLTPDAPGLVAPLARGPGASESTAPREQTSSPAIAKTAKEIAVSVDGRTALTPAIRPVHPDEVPKPRPRWKIPELERLAWAASLVLCLAVGYLAREVIQLRNQRRGAGAPDQIAAVPQANPPAAQVAVTSRQDVNRVTRSRGLADQSRPRDRLAVAPPAATKPSAAHENKASPYVTRNLPMQLAAATPAAPAPARAEPATSSLAGPPQSAGRYAGGAGAPATVESRSAASMGDAAGIASQPALLATFRRVTLEEAVRRLGGPIRQLEGLQPVKVEAGPGHMVPGADPNHDVIRVTYVDANNSPFVLDQQVIDSAGGSFAGLMAGDTLITTTASGSMRVRWLDRKFWLSLAGNATADSLRKLISRVR